MKKGTVITFAAGMLAGMALLGGGSAAASLTASPTSQTFYVGGKQINLQAYAIGGNNYVKLRDIGRAVDFGVTYDGATNSVHIDPNVPYQEEIPVPTSAPGLSGEYRISTEHWSREDFSQQANPAVFTGVYSRELYNAIRQTFIDGGAGSTPAYTMVSEGDDYSAAVNVLGRMSGMTRYEHYVPKKFKNYWQYLDYFAVSVSIPENFMPAVDYVQPVIAEVSRLDSGREKVTYLNDYLCSLLAYEMNKHPGVTQIFAPHNGELKATCGAYAKAFKFLCNAANIPCFTISTNDHAWNMVYVDNQWLHVDVSTNDATHSHTMLLRDTFPNHPDRAPEQTAFIKELLVPGSTK